ncbi:MAG TPA: hypothetical protein VLH61_06430 [Bacteroidales bacterium]|nr:hypothetical protein [Bacteroidales bacterium]
MDKKIKINTVFRKNLVYNTLGELDTNQPEYKVSETLFELPHGKPVKDTHWNADCQMEQQMVYSCTSDGFLLSEEMIDTDGTVLEKRTFEPDGSNLIACELIHYADGSADRINYFRDPQNRVVRKEWYADDTELEAIETFEYEGDKIVKESKTDQDGNFISETIYNYNDQGKISELVVNNTEEETRYTKNYSYDERGNLVMITVFNDEGVPVERVSYENDENGRPISIIEENRRQKITSAIEYNVRGEIIFQSEHDRHGQLIKQLEKTFDESGLLLQTQVLVRDFHTGVSRSYILRNSYEFFNI